jgi:sulfate transport system ATP-binding protein
MGFVGPVSRIDGAWVRPHDIDVFTEPEAAAHEAMVARVARVGFEARIEATLRDGTAVAVQLTRHESVELELAAGDIVWLRPHRVREFSPS